MSGNSAVYRRPHVRPNTRRGDGVLDAGGENRRGDGRPGSNAQGWNPLPGDDVHELYCQISGQVRGGVGYVGGEKADDEIARGKGKKAKGIKGPLTSSGRLCGGKSLRLKT